MQHAGPMQDARLNFMFDLERNFIYSMVHASKLLIV